MAERQTDILIVGGSTGGYRLHPVEWNIGETAELLGAYCFSKSIPPRAVREESERWKSACSAPGAGHRVGLAAYQRSVESLRSI